MRCRWSRIGSGIVVWLAGSLVWSAEPDPEAVRQLMKKYEQETGHDCEIWQATEECGTEACFLDYLEKYPKGGFAKMARARLEEVFWQATEECGTEACFRTYLEKYPEGRFVKMARARLEMERAHLEEVFWQATEECGTEACFRTYLEKYPEGELARMAWARLEEVSWLSTEECGTEACFRAYLEKYPKGRFEKMAWARLEEVSWLSTEECGTEACFRAYLEKYSRGRFAEMALARSGQVSPLKPKMVRITGGCFQMGSPESEKGQFDNERQHQVCVEDFEIGQYEVTQEQWKAVMGDNPSYFKKGDDYPVENVSWNDIQTYLDKLNRQTGRNYRLPTEAEWEYACRGGVTGQSYCGGDDVDRVAWYGENSGSETHPVGRKAVNGFGLYDMSGNVFEWTCSEYDGAYGEAETRCDGAGGGSLRVRRGGSWDNEPRWVRAANRNRLAPANRSYNLGFRLARPF